MKDEDKHELEYRWTFWIDQSSKDKDKYQEDLHNLGTVDSVEDFWICWSAILNHKNLPPQHTLCMFKEGIKPTWEDPQNRDGGRWSIYVQPQIFAYAKRIVNCIFLSVIGCQVEPTDKICGVVVRKRDYGITVDIWSKDISQSPDLSKEVSQKIDAILKAEFGAQVSEDNAIRPTAYNNHPDNAPQLVQAQQSPHGKKRRNQNRRDNNSHARSQHNMSPHSFLYAPSSPHSGSNSGSSSSNGNGSANSVNSVNSLSDFSVNSTLTSSPSNSAMVEPSPPIILGTHKGAKRNISIESDSDSTINNDDDDVDDDDDSSVDVTRKNGSSSSLTPWMAIHKKSASESITDDSQKGGTEKALPILLKKGFDIPTSAYFDIAQKKIDASKPHDNEGSGNGNISEKRKIRCRASVGGGSMPPKFVLDHRRAYSLDKSSEDAYSKYVKTKQGAEKISFEGLSFYTPPRTSSPEDTPLVFAASENSDLPIPGIPSAFPGIGIPGMDGNVSGGRVNDGFNNTVNISGVGNDDDDDWLKQNGSNADTKKFAKRHRSSGLCVVTDISHDDEEEDEDEEENEEGNENEKGDVNENVDVENDKNKQNGNKDVIVGRENKKEEEKTKEKKKESDNSTIKKPDTVEPVVKQKETNKNGLRKRKSSGKHAEDKKEATPVPAATKDTQEESKNKSKGKQERIITLEEYKRNAFILLASIIICAMTMIIILLFISAHFFING